MASAAPEARAGSFFIGVALLAAIGSARAEDNTAAIDKIEITGSNIKRAEAATAENVQVITAEQIKRSGQPTVADYLRTVSANFASYNETATDSFAPGSSGVALRGLSQKNTLVLLNGRRIAVFGFQQNLEDTFVDLNVIPAIAVDRIEILKSGANAIYGSDATAGVVNIILKQNSTERILDAGVSTTTDGGGGTRDAAFSAGFGDLALDRYNVVTTGSVFKRDELLASQRSYTAGQDYRNQPDGYLVWPQSANYFSDANPNQPLAAFPSCGKNGLPGQVVNLASFYPSTNQTGTTCSYNPASQTSLIPGTERANLTTNGIFRLSSNWTAYADVFYSYVKTTVHETPMSLGATSLAYNPNTGGVNVIPNTLPIGNPSNPNPNATTDINYVFQSVGGLDYAIWSNTYRVSGGIKGTWADWDWSADYGHSENHVTQTYYNGINVSALDNAITTGSYNFLYPTASQSAALRQDFAYAGISKLDTLGAKGSGEVFSLPAGKVSVAVGTEFRHESINNQPDANLQNGEILGFGTQTVIGGRSVYSGFGEVTLPILKSLELDLAGREEHYSDVGGNFSPQASLRWQPASFFTLRAVGSKGFRAPSLAEISNASSVSFTQVADPFDPLQRPTESIAEVIKANTHLRPETSKNFDLGMVFSPTADVNLSIDYYRITVDHVIATETAPNNIIDDPAAYPGQIFRTPAGLLNYVVVPYENLYKIFTSGYDIELDTTFHLPHGAKINLGSSATYVTALKFFDGTQWNDTTGTNEWLWLSPIGGGGPVPPLRGSVYGGWENPDWVTQATVRYTSGYQNYCYVAGYCDVTASYTSAFTTLDLYAEYRGIKNWRFSAALNNVFNSTPPWDYLSQPFDITLYDARGRAIELRAQYKF